MSGSNQVLNGPMTVVGMVNGMIGGLILILPLLALQAGYILTLIILIITGSFSYYSCYLCVIHMGDQPDLDYAILKHFNGNRYIKIFYDLCVWSNLMLIDMLYFELITIQWIGLIPPHDQYYIAIPLVNFGVLLGLVFIMKHFQFGASLMAYGIISIITYLLFLIWVVATGDYSSPATAQYKSFGSGAVQLAAAMGGAYSIQSFFIPVLKKNPKSHKYVFYTLMAYILGGFAYLYIAYMGSFGIWHRKYIGSQSSQTIEGYFSSGTWQVMVIQAIYLIHLYSVFPEFLLISKKRMFGVFKLQESHQGKINIAEIIYFVVFIGICLTITMVHVNIDNIIDINGAVIGFFFIYFIPAMLHFKCMYFSKGKMPVPKVQIQNENKQYGKDVKDTAQRKKQIEDIEITSRITDNDVQIRIKQIEEVPQETQNAYNNRRKSIQSSVQASKKKQKQKQKIIMRQSQAIPLNKQDQKQKKKDDLQQYLLESAQSTLPVKIHNTNQIQISNIQFQNSFYYCDCAFEKYPLWRKILDFLFMSLMVLFGAFIMINGVIGVAKGG